MPYKDPEIKRQKDREYKLRNKKIIAEKVKIRHEKVKNDDDWKKRRKEVCEKYRKSNPVRVRKSRMDYINGKGKIRQLLRRRVYMAIFSANGKKAYKTTELLGCSVDECRKWLESKFLHGMTWDNHGYGEGKWNIDHIIPCASFDLTKPEEQLKCFHYTNLQPLWAEDNLSKSDKIQVLTSEGMFLV